MLCAGFVNMPVEIWKASANLRLTAFVRIGVEATLLEEGNGRLTRTLNLRAFAQVY
jgi:hypothetical protein